MLICWVARVPTTELVLQNFLLYSRRGGTEPKWRLALTDFAVSRRIPLRASSRTDYGSFPAQPRHMATAAPEVVRGGCYDHRVMEAWCAGASLLLMVGGLHLRPLSLMAATVARSGSSVADCEPGGAAAAKAKPDVEVRPDPKVQARATGEAKASADTGTAPVESGVTTAVAGAGATAGAGAKAGGVDPHTPCGAVGGASSATPSWLANCLPSGASSELCDLLSRMLVADPAQRMTIAEAMQHTWATARHVDSSE